MPSDQDSMKRTSTGTGIVKHLSSEGCNIAPEDLILSTNERVGILLAGTHPVIGTVRWIVSNRAGIEFDEPLATADIEALRRDHLLTIVAEIVRV